MSILQFKQRETPHMAGNALCIQCGHRWAAAAPVGTESLECPACHTDKGAFVGMCAPEADTEIRECACGNQLFFLTRQGHMCAKCGTYQEYDE